MKILGKEISLADEPGADIPELTCVQKCFDILSKTYDHKFGGFGKSPKFPQAVTFTFLFRYYAQNPGASNNINAKDMCLHTLRCMAKGGIHDHIAKGFHRYSTDEEWHVPHFEKMLYDQAQLALIYSVAYQITKERIYGDVARGILMYVTRDLTDPNDGFYSAEDADSYPTGDSEQKKEGAFCVWTRNEVEKLLNFPLDGNPRQKVYEAFCMYFDVRENGNVHPYQDPHEELKSKNVLMIRHEKEKVAKEFGLSLEQLKANLMHACGILYEARLKRPKPHRDDKMIAAWNGLMISGFVKAGQMLNEKEYIVRAIKAANFIKNNLYKPEMKTLLRSCYRGEDGNIKQIENPIEGFSDDYAFVIQGLLDLYEGCGNYKWLEWAEELQNKQDELFWDTNANGYFMTSGQDSSVVLRMKEDQDGAEPSSNSVSLMNLFRLSAFLGENIYHKKAEAILSTFNDRLNRVPHALPQMLCGVMFYHQKMRQIVIAATRDSKDTHTMVEVVHSFYIPNKVLMFADGDTEDNFLYKRLPLLSSMIPINNQATAYICEGTSCSLPVTSPTALRSILDPHRQKLQ